MWSVEAVADQLASGNGGQIETCSIAEPTVDISLTVPSLLNHPTRDAACSEEPIIGILKQHEAGRKAAELAREHGISEATFYTWNSKYGGLEVNEAQRLKSLEEENRQLKH